MSNLILLRFVAIAAFIPCVELLPLTLTIIRCLDMQKFGENSQVIWLSRRTSRVPEPAVEVKDLQLVTALLQDDIMARDVRLSRR